MTLEDAQALAAKFAEAGLSVGTDLDLGSGTVRVIVNVPARMPGEPELTAEFLREIVTEHEVLVNGGRLEIA